MHSIEVRAEHTYGVHIGGHFQGTLEEVSQNHERVLLIANPLVYEKFSLAHAIAQLGNVELFLTPDGEAQKSVHVTEEIWKKCGSAGLTRSDAIVALGGGATGIRRGLDVIPQPGRVGLHHAAHGHPSPHGRHGRPGQRHRPGIPGVRAHRHQAVRRGHRVARVDHAMQAHEELLHVPVEAALALRRGVHLDEGVVTAFHAHAERERGRLLRRADRAGEQGKTELAVADLQPGFDLGQPHRQ